MWLINSAHAARHAMGRHIIERTGNVAAFNPSNFIFSQAWFILLSALRVLYGVGMVFQHFELYLHMTAIDNITLAAIRIQKQSKKDAEKVTRQSTVHAVIGGFHLLSGGSQLENMIEYFKENKAMYLSPMHCTDLATLSSFHRIFGIQKLCAGDRLEFKS